MFNRRKKSRKPVTGPRELIVHNDPRSAISEQYRTIRTNIMYSSIDKKIKKVMVTSAGPSAGKSTTAVNIATAFAQAGRKTILIDADMRRPTTQYTFEVTNSLGLSSAIVNTSKTDQVIKPTEIDNLDLITSGPIPPNPAELLQSTRMNNLLKVLSEAYDVIIIDTPPLLTVADAQILSKAMDGVLLVTNTEDNDRDELMKAKDTLVKSGANILGVVLNNKKRTDNENYYYYGMDDAK